MKRGFTLLETVVAMAILSLSLMALFDLNAGALVSHAYSKKLTVASLLARAKMTDLEQSLYDEPLSPDAVELDGDFSEEGWPRFKWRARIRAPKTEALSTDKLVELLFGFPISGAVEAASGGATGAPGGDTAASGMLAGLAQAQLTPLLAEIKQTLREVHLTVEWPDGNTTEKFDVITYVVSRGPGSDRNIGTAGGGVPGLPGTPGAPGTPSGTPVLPPTPGGPGTTPRPLFPGSPGNIGRAFPGRPG
ncbi:MAG: prepilin-type N-terminal cleavage/methylation domain-containing protein [Myxococcaceae bacterium]